jgi:hypothetical protein
LNGWDGAFFDPIMVPTVRLTSEAFDIVSHMDLELTNIPRASDLAFPQEVERALLGLHHHSHTRLIKIVSALK